MLFLKSIAGYEEITESETGETEGALFRDLPEAAGALFLRFALDFACALLAAMK